jgi:hypothetical protein
MKKISASIPAVIRNIELKKQVKKKTNKVYRPAIIKHNSSNEEKFWPRLSATIK